MREILGNGDRSQGGKLLMALALGLREERRKNPVFAEGPYQALGVVGERYEDFSKAVLAKDHTQRGKALSLMLALIRFLNEEHHPEVGLE